jgi:hypothetical protein
MSDDVKEVTIGKCDPKPVCISNPLTTKVTTPNQIPWPPCINIHRCDGCCPSNENCVAIKEHEVKLQKVGLIEYGDRNVFNEMLTSVTNHTECQCQCKWLSDADCKLENENFIKNPNGCECICPDRLYCDAFHEFDKNTCSCICRRDRFEKIEQTCKFRNFNWNVNTCKCESARAAERQSSPVNVMRIFV